MTTTFDPHAPGFQKIRLTSDELTFDELDTFVELTGEEVGKASNSKTLRALVVLGMARQGVTITFADLGAIRINDVLDVDHLAAAGTKTDPTVAGA